MLAERWIAQGALAALAAALAIASAFGPMLGVAAVVVAAFLAALAMVGRDRMVLVCFAAAFGTAPVYKGLEFGVPVTDVCLFAGMLLMVPELVTRRVRLPAVFVCSVVLVIALGLRSSLASANPSLSLSVLIQWMAMLALVPIVVAVWQPGRFRINLLLGSYLVGHVVSTVVAFAEGPAGSDRYDGLTIHPVIFGYAGATCVAIVAYLFWQYTAAWPRLLLIGMAVLGLVTTVMSGSRTATAAAAALLLIVPLAERTAFGALAVAALAVLGVLMLPVAGAASSEGSSLARLAGEGSAERTNSARTEALSEGVARFLQHPLIGRGFDHQAGFAHNAYLEVAIGVGIFGAIAYVVVLLMFIRPLFSPHPSRRLSYLTLAAIMLAATAPSVIDRTTWLPMTLAILPVIGALARRRDGPDAPSEHAAEITQ